MHNTWQLYYHSHSITRISNSNLVLKVYKEGCGCHGNLPTTLQSFQTSSATVALVISVAWWGLKWWRPDYWTVDLRTGSSKPNPETHPTSVITKSHFETRIIRIITSSNIKYISDLQNSSSENGKCPICHRKSAFSMIFRTKSGNSTLPCSSPNSVSNWKFRNRGTLDVLRYM